MSSDRNPRNHNAIQFVCLTAAITIWAVNVALEQQRFQDRRRISTIESLLDTELAADRISTVAYGAIHDELRLLEYPSLYGNWFVRNISFMTSGLLMGSVLAGLLARKATAPSSPNKDRDEPGL